MRSVRFRPGVIPCMNSVSSEPTSRTNRSGYCARSASAFPAALVIYASVSAWLLSHISGDSHTSSPNCSAISAALTSRLISSPQIRTALQCRSSRMISSSRCTTFGSKSGRQLPAITRPTS